MTTAVFVSSATVPMPITEKAGNVPGYILQELCVYDESFSVKNIVMIRSEIKLNGML